MTLCFGDGFADILGQFQKGNRKLLWNPKKSVYGLSAFVMCSFLASTLYVYYFSMYDLLGLV